MRGQEEGAEVLVGRQRRRRQRCPSLHSLLRRQLQAQRTKMAAAFRKLFRSGEKPEAQYPPVARGATTCKNAGRDQGGGGGGAAKGQNATPRGQGSNARMQNSSSGRSQASGAWSQNGGTGGEVLAAGGHNGLNSPSTARRFFSRHSYLEGSRVGPAEGVVPQHSPKSSSSSSNRSKNQPTSTAPSASPSSGVMFKKSPPQGGILNESTSKHMKMVRTRRLMKEYQELSRVQQTAKDPVFTVDLVNDCLYEWKVKLLRVDSESELYRDMQELGVHHILLSLSFPENFPFHPPFLRVLSPRLEKGFVMEGGAICMELLTPRGWASAYTIEAVIMQFAASLVKGQGRISRKHKAPKEFSKRSAESAFRSLVKTHEKYGWVTPPLSEG
ncbi:uncharacterized protein [Panulirus ornatus]|uniref:uncharacterized protein n=1 Tax=Panulirus ornatus TaxID=150431 RepID=UPI003A8A2191